MYQQPGGHAPWGNQLPGQQHPQGPQHGGAPGQSWMLQPQQGSGGYDPFAPQQQQQMPQHLAQQQPMQQPQPGQQWPSWQPQQQAQQAQQPQQPGYQQQAMFEGPAGPQTSPYANNMPQVRLCSLAEGLRSCPRHFAPVLAAMHLLHCFEQ